MPDVRRTLILTLTLSLPPLTATVEAQRDLAEPAAAVASPGDPVLAALVAEALERSPDLRAEAEAVQAARAVPAQVRALPDPMAAVSYTNDGWSPSLGEMMMTRLSLMWSQELPYPGKLPLRGELAALGAGRADQGLERARLSLAADVSRAYYGLLLARERLELVREQAALWKQTEGVALARYAVGQGAQQDVLRVQVEVTRIGQLQAQEEAQAVIRLAEINRLRDRALDAPVDTAARLALRTPALPEEQLFESLRATNPELLGARLAVDEGRVGLRLAERERQPDFNVQAGYMHRGSLDPMWQVGVGIRLPLRRAKLRAGVAEAEARLRAAELRAESAALQLRYRTRERLTQLHTLERIAHLYSDGIIPQDRMSMAAALANYQAGKVPFLTVLEALATLYGDRTTHLDLLAEHERTRVALAEGRLDAPESMRTGGAAPLLAGSRLSMGGMGAGAPMREE